MAERKQLRLETLHALELGNNDTAAIADLIATAVLRRHLETMERLGIEYDFLPRESEILTLHFWDAARALMIEKGVLYLETKAKTKAVGSCAAQVPTLKREVTAPTNTPRSSSAPTAPSPTSARTSPTISGSSACSPARTSATPASMNIPTTPAGSPPPARADPGHPTFGKADAIYNVIDSRQNDPQTQVVQALRGMGYTDAADRYTHFSYEMVALTPRCAMDLGYPISEEDQKRAYIEVSGRKGFGVKADDLLDRLIAAAKTEVDNRHPELPEDERADIARQIGVGALRYFMLRYTRNTVIAFDFKDALSFEGETGPYVQYAIVRALNIFRKAATTAEEALAAFETITTADLSAILDSEEGSSLWETWLLTSRLTQVIEQAIATAEPAYLAKYAFQLAQQFNNFYHRHHILNETDPTRKALLLATAAAAQREMTRALGYLGIEAPPVM